MEVATRHRPRKRTGRRPTRSGKSTVPTGPLATVTNRLPLVAEGKRELAGGGGNGGHILVVAVPEVVGLQGEF